MPQVQSLVGADEALGDQRVGIPFVVRLFVHRHQPPDGGAAGQPDGGAIELVQQQVVLGGAAVLRAELVIPLAANKARRVDQEKVRLGPLARCPGFQQLTLLAQLGEFVLAQIRCVAHPDIHIALVRLGQGAETAHQEQAMDGAWRVAAVARLVGKRSGQALGIGEGGGVRLVIRQPGRCIARDVAGQQRMIDVKEQWQQRQHRLLTARQTFERTGDTAFVER